MGTLKWKNKDNNWETFYYGAFENIKADLRNIVKAINNSAAAIRMRCRRDKNLSDIYDAAAGRTNLQLINDCSALPKAPHHHDSRYIPKIQAEARARQSEDDALWEAIGSLQDEVDDTKKSVKKMQDDEEKKKAASGGEVNQDLGNGYFYIGDYLVQFGCSLATERERVPYFNDPIMNNNPGGDRTLECFKHRFVIPWPNKCIRLFWYDARGDSNDDASDTNNFVDHENGYRTKEFFYTKTRYSYVRYIAIGN